MNKLIALLILTGTSLLATAQNRYTLEAAQAFGYESNVFWIPSSYTNGGEQLQRADSYTNAPFSQTRFAIGFKTRLNKKSDLKLDGKLRHTQYVSPLMSASRINLSARYRYKFNKITIGSLTALTGRTERMGVGALPGEVRKLEYNYAQLGAAIATRRLKNNTSKLYVNTGLRRYSPLASGLNLSYNYRTIGVNTTQKLNKQESLMLNLSTATRRYTSRFNNDATTGVDEEDVELGIITDTATGVNGMPITFRIMEAKAQYKFKVSDQQFYRMYVRYQGRRDLSQAGNGFRELRVGNSAHQRVNRVGIAVGGYIAQRNYTDRLAHTIADTEETLVYRLLSFNITPKYYINEQLTAFARVSAYFRRTNSDRDDVLYRSDVDNWQVAAGLSCKLSGKPSKSQSRTANMRTRSKRNKTRAQYSLKNK